MLLYHPYSSQNSSSKKVGRQARELNNLFFLIKFSFKVYLLFPPGHLADVQVLGLFYGAFVFCVAECIYFFPQPF